MLKPRNIFVIVLVVVLAATLALVATHRGDTRTVIAQQRAAVSADNVKVTGTPEEVALVQSILSNLGSLTIDSVAVGQPDPSGKDAPMPDDGQVWLNVTYPVNGPQNEVRATFESELLVDAYAAQCASAGVPCEGGFSLSSDTGVTNFSAKFTPDPKDQPADTPTQQLVSRVQAAAAKTSLADVQVTSVQSATSVILVTATVNDVAGLTGALGTVWHSIPAEQPMLLELRDAQTGAPIAEESRSVDGGSGWIDPKWRAAMYGPDGPTS